MIRDANHVHHTLRVFSCFVRRLSVCFRLTSSIIHSQHAAQTAFTLLANGLHTNLKAVCYAIFWYLYLNTCEMKAFLTVFFPWEECPGECFETEFTCTCSSPMLFSPLTKHHAAGWRSRQRQQIRGTGERRENGGGRGGRTPWPQSTMSYLVLCPPCLYLLHMDVETVRSCLLPAHMEMRMERFLQMTVLPQPASILRK